MTSKNLLNKKTEEAFLNEAVHLGISLGTANLRQLTHYVDIESFFLSATYNLHSSRIAEGFLCWLLRYGHLLSPSKIRRLIRGGCHYDSHILNAILHFLMVNKINQRQWIILKPYARKSRKRRELINGPQPKNPDPIFLKQNVVTHKFVLDAEKFLAPTLATYKRCIELKNRALFGSSVHADVASYLLWNNDAKPYQTALATGNHKARVFEIFEDIKMTVAISPSDKVA